MSDLIFVDIIKFFFFVYFFTMLFWLMNNLKNYLSLPDQTVQWIGAQFCVCKFLDSRYKSQIMFENVSGFHKQNFTGFLVAKSNKSNVPTKLRLQLYVCGIHWNVVCEIHLHFEHILRLVSGIQEHTDTKLCSNLVHSLAS